MDELDNLGNEQFTSPITTLLLQQREDQTIGNIGSILSNVGLNMYSKLQSQEAINQAYNDASQGKFNSIPSITGANQQYNQVMQQLAPSILASKSGSLFEQYYNQVRTNPNFNPQTAVQDYTNGVAPIVAKYMDNIPDEWKGRVGLLVNQQATNYGVKLAQDVVQNNYNNAKLSSLQSIQDLTTQRDNANQSGNYSLANSLQEQLNNNLQASQNAGFISPEQVFLHKSQDAINSLVAQSIANGKLVDKPDNITQEQYQQVVSGFSSQYRYGQETINDAQAKEGINPDLILAQARDSGTRVSTSTLSLLTDAQKNRYNTALYEYGQGLLSAQQDINSSSFLGNAVTNLANINPTKADIMNIVNNNLVGYQSTDNQFNDTILKSAQFYNSLPERYKSKFINNLTRTISANNDYPAEGQGIDINSNYQDIVNNYTSRNINPNTIKDPLPINVANAWSNQLFSGNQNQQSVIDNINAQYKDLAPQVLSQITRIANIDKSAGATLALNSGNSFGYLNSGVTNLLDSKNILTGKNKLNSDNLQLYNSFDPISQQHIIGYINANMRLTGNNANQAINTLFDDNGYLHKDTIVLTNPNFVDYINSISSKQSQIPDTISHNYQYNVNNDTYRVIDNDGRPTDKVFTRNDINGFYGYPQKDKPISAISTSPLLTQGMP